MTYLFGGRGVPHEPTQAWALAGALLGIALASGVGMWRTRDATADLLRELPAMLLAGAVAGWVGLGLGQQIARSPERNLFEIGFPTAASYRMPAFGGDIPAACVAIGVCLVIGLLVAGAIRAAAR